MDAGSGFPPAPLRVRHDVDPSGSVRLILTGEIDVSSVDLLTQGLAAVPVTDRLVIDLAGVTFLDSTGLAALVVAHRRAAAAGRSLAVVNARGIVRRVLEVTGTFPILAGWDPSPPQRV
jgi:anti-sigma B factor antagonist